MPTGSTAYVEMEAVYPGLKAGHLPIANYCNGVMLPTRGRVAKLSERGPRRSSYAGNLEMGSYTVSAGLTTPSRPRLRKCVYTMVVLPSPPYFSLPAFNVSGRLRLQKAGGKNIQARSRSLCVSVTRFRIAHDVQIPESAPHSWPSTHGEWEHSWSAPHV
jgi:hypothetical protein